MSKPNEMPWNIIEKVSFNPPLDTPGACSGSWHKTGGVVEIDADQARALWLSVKKIIILAKQIESHSISPFEAESGVITISEQLLKKGIGE